MIPRMVILALFLGACDRPSTRPDPVEYPDIHTWFSERGIQLPAEELEQTAKASSDSERLLGDVTGNGTVSLWDLRALWDVLTTGDTPRWYDMDLLDIDRDGDTDWTDLKLMGEFLTNPERGNPYGIGLPLARPFELELVFTDGISQKHRAMCREAAAVWENLVTGDIPDWPTSWGEVLDTDDFDGWAGSEPGRLFGRLHLTGGDDRYDGYASQLVLRGADPGFPLAGYVMLSNRMLTEASDERVRTVMLHELGHVMGIGAARGWDELLVFPSRDRPGRDAHFRGRAARAAFIAAGGTYRWFGVPVQNRGLGRDTHWRGSHVPNELMASASRSCGRP